MSRNNDKLNATYWMRKYSNNEARKCAPPGPLTAVNRSSTCTTTSEEHELTRVHSGFPRVLWPVSQPLKNGYRVVSGSHNTKCHRKADSKIIGPYPQTTFPKIF